MRFGDYVRDRRQRQGWTQPDAAKRIGIEQSYLSKLETGKSYPSEDVFSSLVATYKIDLTDLEKTLFPAELDQLREIGEVRAIILKRDAVYKNRVQRWLTMGVLSLAFGGACLGAAMVAEDEDVTNYLYKFETEVPVAANDQGTGPVQDGPGSGTRTIEDYKSLRKYRGVVFREPTTDGERLWRFYGSEEETLKSPLRWFMVPAIMLLASAIGCFFASYRSR